MSIFFLLLSCTSANTPVISSDAQKSNTGLTTPTNIAIPGPVLPKDPNEARLALADAAQNSAINLQAASQEYLNAQDANDPNAGILSAIAANLISVDTGDLANVILGIDTPQRVLDLQSDPTMMAINFQNSASSNSGFALDALSISPLLGSMYAGLYFAGHLISSFLNFFKKFKSSVLPTESRVEVGEPVVTYVSGPSVPIVIAAATATTGAIGRIDAIKALVKNRWVVNSKIEEVSRMLDAFHHSLLKSSGSEQDILDTLTKLKRLIGQRLSVLEPITKGDKSLLTEAQNLIRLLQIFSSNSNAATLIGEYKNVVDALRSHKAAFHNELLKANKGQMPAFLFTKLNDRFLDLTSFSVQLVSLPASNNAVVSEVRQFVKQAVHEEMKISSPDLKDLNIDTELSPNRVANMIALALSHKELKPSSPGEVKPVHVVALGDATSSAEINENVPNEEMKFGLRIAYELVGSDLPLKLQYAEIVKGKK